MWLYIILAVIGVNVALGMVQEAKRPDYPVHYEHHR